MREMMENGEVVHVKSKKGGMTHDAGISCYHRHDLRTGNNNP